MDKPPLSVTDLHERGFTAVARWRINGARLICEGDVPNNHGVYAFALNEQITYVGLAAKSVAKRIYFYTNPRPSQSTNIRVNALISAAMASAAVRVLVATPPDFRWNGLLVRGAEGLEAGLIQTFDLAWNLRGAAQPVRSVAADKASMISAPDLAAGIIALVNRRQDLSEREIAEIFFGRSGYQQKVNPVCRQLVARGQLLRIGIGGVGDPYRYRTP